MLHQVGEDGGETDVEDEVGRGERLQQDTLLAQWMSDLPSQLLS
jgi:hypothetical protein